METLPYLTDECRATLFSSTAYSDDIIPTLVKILRDILWIVAADIDPDFSHHFDRKRVNLCGRLYTGRTDLSLGMKMLKDSMVISYFTDLTDETGSACRCTGCWMTYDDILYGTSVS